MEDNLIIDKIKKLIALSECPSATAHEKALALAKAQALLLKYAIDKSILGTANQEVQIVEVQFTLNKPIFGLESYNLCQMLNIIGPGFGCYSYYKSRTNTVWLMGFPLNCEIVDYTAHVLINQGVRDCFDLWTRERSANTKLAFWKGFSAGLLKRYNLKPEHQDTGLALYDKVKQKFQASTTTGVAKFQGGSSEEAFGKGSKSAQEAQVKTGLHQANSTGIKSLT